MSSAPAHGLDHGVIHGGACRAYGDNGQGTQYPEQTDEDYIHHYPETVMEIAAIRLEIQSFHPRFLVFIDKSLNEMPHKVNL